MVFVDTGVHEELAGKRFSRSHKTQKAAQDIFLSGSCSLCLSAKRKFSRLHYSLKAHQNLQLTQVQINYSTM
jgi:hypothetical protein